MDMGTKIGKKVAKGLAEFGTQKSADVALKNSTLPGLPATVEGAKELASRGAQVCAKMVTNAAVKTPLTDWARGALVDQVASVAGPGMVATAAGKALAGPLAKKGAREVGLGKVGQERSKVAGKAAGAVGVAAAVGLATAGPAGAAGGAAVAGLGTLAGPAVEYGVHAACLRAGLTKKPKEMSTSIEVGETMMTAGEGGLHGMGISWLELRESQCGAYAYALSVKTSKKLHIDFQDSDGCVHSLTCELPRTHNKRFNAERPTITKLTITPLE